MEKVSSYDGEVRYKRSANRKSYFEAISKSATFMAAAPEIYQNIIVVPESSVRNITYGEAALPIKKSTEIKTKTEDSESQYAYKVTSGDLVNPDDGFNSFKAVITVNTDDDLVKWSWNRDLPPKRDVNLEYEHTFAKLAHKTLAEIDQYLLRNA